MPNWIDRLRRWALPALAALAVAGCARTEPGTTTVRFWAMGREAEVVSELIHEFEAENPGSKVDVVYTNDAAVNGVDRNLYVQQISTTDTAVLPTDAIVSLDKGSGDGAFDGQNVVAGTTGLYSNGALRLTWPAPNLTERLTVRATTSGATSLWIISWRSATRAPSRFAA